MRDACVDDVLAEAAAICERRGLSFLLEETMRAAAAPSAPEWQARWERAVAAAGLPVHRMPSGAGHDAMKLAEVMPQAMLFVRGENAGISHNPLESTTADDMRAGDRGVRAHARRSRRRPAAHRRRGSSLDEQDLDNEADARLDAWIDAHFDDEVALPAGAGARADRHAAGQQRAARRDDGDAARRLRLRRRALSGARRRWCARTASSRSPTWSFAAATATARRSPSTRTATSSRRAKAGRHDPYGGEVVGGRLYGRAAAVSKSDFATYTFAVRALESLGAALAGGVELHFTYDEEFGGELGPGWLLKQGLVKPDLLIAAGFSYQVVTAHNGCLQLEVTVHGKMAHAAIPASGVDALQGAVAILNALYAQNEIYRGVTSRVAGITHPYLNVGTIEGGTNTNVVPGKVVLKLDRRMIPEEDPVAVEATLRRVIADAAASRAGITVEVRRLLLARALTPLPGNAALVAALQRHGEAVFGEPIPVSGTPLYTDVRLYGEAGIPAAIYGAGPRTVLESNAKRADEHLELEDLRRATKVVARTLCDLLSADRKSAAAGTPNRRGR